MYKRMQLHFVRKCIPASPFPQTRDGPMAVALDPKRACWQAKSEPKGGACIILHGRRCVEGCGFVSVWRVRAIRCMHVSREVPPSGLLLEVGGSDSLKGPVRSAGGCWSPADGRQQTADSRRQAASSDNPIGGRHDDPRHRQQRGRSKLCTS